MTGAPAWLPPLVLLNSFAGDWDSYLGAIYTWFKRDFVDNRPMFRGQRLGLKRHPLVNGKEATFWHMISEGSDEKNRIPDLRRCERIRWPKPVIENEHDPKVKCWVSFKRGEDRIHIWLEEEDYVVVLANRRGFLLPWTAFLVTRRHTKEKLRKEHEKYREEVASKG